MSRHGRLYRGRAFENPCPKRAEIQAVAVVSTRILPSIDRLERQKRMLYSSAAVALMPLGFATKCYHGHGEAWVFTHGGDILYPAFWFFVLLFLFPRLSSQRAAVIVLIFSTVVEFSQLAHWPLLMWLRRSFIGRTLVGTCFSPIDIFYYTISSLFAVWMRGRLHRLFLPAAAAKPQRHGDAF